MVSFALCADMTNTPALLGLWASTLVDKRAAVFAVGATTAAFACKVIKEGVSEKVALGVCAVGTVLVAKSVYDANFKAKADA